MPTVTFLPMSVAEGIRQESNIISIGSPGGEQPAWRTDHPFLHRVEFSADDERGDPGYVPFDAAMATSMVNFIEGLKDQDIVVHCKYGISRSAAVALFVNEKFGHELVFHRKGRKDLVAADRNVYEYLKLAKMRLDAVNKGPKTMQFFSRVAEDHGVTIEPTKAAICDWYDNNDAAVDSAALEPEKMVSEAVGDGRFKISYWFSSGRATMIGYTDVEPQ